MTAEPRVAPHAEDRELVIVRMFDAPRQLVFAAWTEVEHVTEWMAPHGMSVEVLEWDLRPGGRWRKVMRTPDGKEYWRYGKFREIVPPERLVFTYFSDDAHSDPTNETLITLRFEEVGNRTRMHFRQSFFGNVAERDAHGWGWGQALERLESRVAAVHAASQNP